MDSNDGTHHKKERNIRGRVHQHGPPPAHSPGCPWVELCPALLQTSSSAEPCCGVKKTHFGLQHLPRGRRHTFLQFRALFWHTAVLSPSAGTSTVNNKANCTTKSGDAFLGQDRPLQALECSWICCMFNGVNIPYGFQITEVSWTHFPSGKPQDKKGTAQATC